MTHSLHRAQLLLFPLLALACGSSSTARPADASAQDSAMLTADAAIAEDTRQDDSGEAQDDGGAQDALSPAPHAVGLAVVHIDGTYTSSLLSLVDPGTGMLLRDDCINSGKVPPGLSQGMSGDVVLPSAPLPGHPLILIDRGNGNLIWLNPADCSVTKQISVAQGFMANPYDVLAVTANKLYVTRYGSNPKPSTALAGGGDLLIVDLTQGQPVARIDLAPHVSGTGFTPNPARGSVLDGKLYVTLNSFNADFSKAATGRIVVVDPSSDTVTGTIDLPGLQNCGPIVSVPGMPKGLAVACAGPFSAADDATRLKVSGIALIDTATTPPTVTSVMASLFGRPVSTTDLAVVGAGLGLVVVPGDKSGTPADALWRFDFAGGAPQKVLSGSTSFVLGGLIYDPGSKRMFVGDADSKNPKLRVLDVSSATPVELAPINSDPLKGLLPRNMGLY